jgi:cyanophycinase
MFGKLAICTAPIMLAAAPLAAKSGSLLIVGGGLNDQKSNVLGEMLASMPGRSGSIAIIPSASGEASVAARELTEALVKVGVDGARVSTVHIAMIDDEESKDVDEAGWAGNAANPAEIAKIEAAGAIWFTGGDQLRTLRLLVNADGSDTPMLAAVRKRLAAGAVVAGTSAGAAIMGSGMIVCGTPDIAATGKVSRNPTDCDVPGDKPVPLVLGQGLGFLKGTVVDQHFSQRNRWVRLLRATACIGGDVRQGFGIDEDTALLIDLASGRARVIGEGGVAHALRGPGGTCDPFAFTGQSLSYRRAPDAFRIKLTRGESK